VDTSSQQMSMVTHVRCSLPDRAKAFAHDATHVHRGQVPLAWKRKLSLVVCVVLASYILLVLSYVSPCGGGLKCLHPILASRKRCWVGSPVPEGIAEPPCLWGGYKYKELISNETMKNVLSPARLLLRSDCTENARCTLWRNTILT
jgi:hypothetical protein